MSATTFKWMVTAPNPRHPGTGYDAGQRGWKLHAIALKRGENYDGWKRRTALCENAMTKREAAGEVFIDLADLYRAEREQVELQLALHIRESKRNGSDLSDDDIEELRQKFRAALEPT